MFEHLYPQQAAEERRVLVQVHSAYVAGRHCADVTIPDRQPVHLERASRNTLERAVRRLVIAACMPPRPGHSITVQWHIMRSLP
jgi:hypothetical protein